MDLIRLGRLACAQRKIEVLYQRKRRYMVYFVQMNYVVTERRKGCIYFVHLTNSIVCICVQTKEVYTAKF